eukprot:6184050-Pleurochrysis_carterae.AAC.1
MANAAPLCFEVRAAACSVHLLRVAACICCVQLRACAAPSRACLPLPQGQAGGAPFLHDRYLRRERSASGVHAPIHRAGVTELTIRRMGGVEGARGSFRSKRVEARLYALIRCVWHGRMVPLPSGSHRRDGALAYARAVVKCSQSAHLSRQWSQALSKASQSLLDRSSLLLQGRGGSISSRFAVGFEYHEARELQELMCGVESGAIFPSMRESSMAEHCCAQ